MSELFLVLLVSGLQFTNQQAANKAAEAYYKQSGAERSIQEWTDRNTSADFRARVGELTFISRTIVTQTVTFSWGFP